MRIMITRSALICGIIGIASCSFQQNAKPEVQPVARPEQKTEEPRLPRPSSQALSSGTEKEASSMNHRETGTPVVSPDSLPGDTRGGLRSPKLPNSLPMTIDGKINRGD